jgi:hypothetical protein
MRVCNCRRFERKLIFDESCREVLPPDVAQAMHARAVQIADSLKAGLFFRPAAAV